MLKDDYSLTQEEIDYIYRKYKPPINLDDFIGNPQFKDFLCYNWIRGLCQEGDLCRYAHGVDKLIYHRDSPNIKRPRFPYINYEKEEKNYSGLFEYQKKLLERGVVKELIPIEVLNKTRLRRMEIRDHFHVEITTELIIKILEVFDEIFITRMFVEKEIQRLGLKCRFVSPLYGKAFYERKVPVPPRLSAKFLAIRRMPSHEQMTNLVCSKIVKLTNELIDSGEKLPITSDVIFQKYYSVDDYTEPTLKFFLKTSNMSFDSILEGIEKKIEWREKLRVTSMDNPEHSKLCIYRTNKIELEARAQQLREICEGIFASKIKKFPDYFTLAIKWRNFEEAVFAASPDLKKFLNNDKTLLRTFLQNSLVKRSYYPFFFQAQHFIFDLNFGRFKKGGKLVSERKQKCAFNTSLPSSKFNQSQILTEEVFKEATQNVGECRITVIDSRQSFEAAAHFLRSFQYLGIDLEGPIFYGIIDLIAISVSCDKPSSDRVSKIFIFDIFSIEKSEDSSLKSEVRLFLKEILEDPRRIKVFHDSRKDSFALHLHMNICPRGIFDVSALHCLCEQLELYIRNNTDNCLDFDSFFLMPFKIKDSEGAKTPVERPHASESLNQEEKQVLRMQKKAEKIKKNKKKESNPQDLDGIEPEKEESKQTKDPNQRNFTKQPVFKPFPKKKEEPNSKVYQIKNPGLNEVLAAYGAKNGINQLKDSMKKMFLEKERDFFLRRPLEQGFLEYTAKDVEDLIEVHFKIKLRILDQLKALSSFKDADTTLELCEAMINIISRSYAESGCMEASKMGYSNK